MSSTKRWRASTSKLEMYVPRLIASTFTDFPVQTTLEMTKNAQIWPRSMNAMLGGEPKKIYLVSASIGEIGGQGLDFIGSSDFPCLAAELMYHRWIHVPPEVLY